MQTESRLVATKSPQKSAANSSPSLPNLPEKLTDSTTASNIPHSRTIPKDSSSDRLSSLRETPAPSDTSSRPLDVPAASIATRIAVPAPVPTLRLTSSQKSGLDFEKILSKSQTQSTIFKSDDTRSNENNYLDASKTKAHSEVSDSSDYRQIPDDIAQRNRLSAGFELDLLESYNLLGRQTGEADDNDEPYSPLTKSFKRPFTAPPSTSAVLGDHIRRSSVLSHIVAISKPDRLLSDSSRILHPPMAATLMPPTKSKPFEKVPLSMQLPVFVYNEDETCNFFNVAANTCLNEVRLEAMAKLGFSEVVETYQLFFMENASDGKSLEYRVEHNHPVASFVNPSSASVPLKFRIRQKPVTRWSIAVHLEFPSNNGSTASESDFPPFLQPTNPSLKNVRCISVGTDMCTRDVIETLCDLENVPNDERAELGLYQSALDGTGCFLSESDSIASPWDRTSNVRYALKLVVDEKRKKKLSTVFGISSEVMEKETEDARRIAFATKVPKLIQVLGINEDGTEANKDSKGRSSSQISPSTTMDSNLNSADNSKSSKLRPVTWYASGQSVNEKEEDTRKIDTQSSEAHRQQRRTDVTIELTSADSGNKITSKSRMASETLAKASQMNIRRESLGSLTFRPSSGKMPRNTSSEAIAKAIRSFSAKPNGGSSIGLEKDGEGGSSVSSPVGAGIRKTFSSDSVAKLGRRASAQYDGTQKSGLRQRVHIMDDHSENSSLTSIATAAKDPSQRTDKLASFFGAGEKELNEISSIIQKRATIQPPSKKIVTDKDGSQILVRVYFGNLTYTSLSLPISATAEYTKIVVLNKLMIKDGTSNYGLYECSQQSKDEREIGSGERLYDIMIQWEQAQIFVFKKRGGRNHLRSTSRPSSIDAQYTGGGTGATVLPARRVAKLAGFFGVTDQKQQQISKKKTVEIAELFKMLNIMSFEAVTLAGQLSSLKQQFIQVDNVYKEGWLYKAGMEKEGKPSWSSCWASVENGTLQLRLAESRDEAIPSESWNKNKSPKKASADGTTEWKISLTLGIVESLHYSAFKRHAFQLMDKNGNKYTFAAETLQESDDWVNSIKVASRLATGNTAHPSAIKVQGTEEKPASGSNDKVSSTDDSQMTIKDFEIHKVIGRGKFAKVLLCSQKSTGKVYAIKVMSKGEPGDSNTESQILRSIRHPFIVGLHYAFESKERLYLVMEYVNGGELYFHISNFGRFSEERVCFYAAEILLAVGCLHRKGVIYRDLKLENVLLAKDGHVKITDFGLSKQGADVESEVIEIVGTLEYLAPEVILGREYSFAADWWAYGVILFEMLCGFHPFYDEDPNKIRKLIVDGLIEFPHFVSKESVDLLVRLLNRNPSERIKMEDIQKHVFFSTIDFDKLFRKELPPPFVPELVDDFDVRFFDEIFTEEPVSWTPIGSEEMLNSL